MNGIFRKSMLGDRPLYDKSKIQSHHFTLCFSSWSPIAQRLFPHRWRPSVFEIETNISVLVSEARCTSFQILINYQFRACAEINSIRPTDAIVTFELNHLVIRPDNETRGNPLRDEVAPLSPVSDLKEQRRL